MARGNEILIGPGTEPKGRYVEGIVAAGQTFYPGMAVQIDPTIALVGGKWTHKIFDADADGGRPKGPIVIVLNDPMQGKVLTDSYAAGTRFFGYIPLPGDELNLLLLNITGTADDHAVGEILIIDDTTGKFIATTGSPETEPAMLLEAVTDPLADTLVWCIW